MTGILDLGILNISRYSATRNLGSQLVSHRPCPPEIFAMGKLFMKGLRDQIVPGGIKDCPMNWCDTPTSLVHRSFQAMNSMVQGG
mmetsp:Transcript_84430/g.133754  ORF Transcript_84430/g.133754 Transcript_84430/m.133754 type:complete len:85 (-) Transcript_84430:61-315(-)